MPVNDISHRLYSIPYRSPPLHLPTHPQDPSTTTTNPPPQSLAFPITIPITSASLQNPMATMTHKAMHHPSPGPRIPHTGRIMRTLPRDRQQHPDRDADRSRPVVSRPPVPRCNGGRSAIDKREPIGWGGIDAVGRPGRAKHAREWRGVWGGGGGGYKSRRSRCL